MIKYRTYLQRIETVEIARETEKQVVLMGGRRSNKIGDYEGYFDTWDQAKQHLLDKTECEVQERKASLEYAKDKLGNIKGMKRLF